LAATYTTKHGTKPKTTGASGCSAQSSCPNRRAARHARRHRRGSQRGAAEDAQEFAGRAAEAGDEAQRRLGIATPVIVVGAYFAAIIADLAWDFGLLP